MNTEKNAKYMQRLDQEYEIYQVMISGNSTEWYLDHAEEMANMKQAYHYLKSPEISSDELDYIMRARRPIEAAASTKAAFGEGSSISQTVYDMYHNKMLDGGDYLLYAEDLPVVFQRKPAALDEMRLISTRTENDPYKVEKIIELTPEGFEHFTESLISDYPFITDNKDLMWFDEEGYHCLLITTAERKEGLLVESDGFDYARYCADVPDISKLEIGDVPVEKYGRRQGRNRTITKHEHSHER